MLLDKLLPSLRRQGHRVLLFSQFKMLLDLIEDYVRLNGYAYERLDGSVRTPTPTPTLTLTLTLTRTLTRSLPGHGRGAPGGHRPLHRGPGQVPLPDRHARGRRRDQPGGRRHGDHLRPRLEPAERHPGPGALRGQGYGIGLGPNPNPTPTPTPNPDQARCHRIGQTKTVNVYRLVTRGTYEEPPSTPSPSPAP